MLGPIARGFGSRVRGRRRRLMWGALLLYVVSRFVSFHSVSFRSVLFCSVPFCPFLFCFVSVVESHTPPHIQWSEGG